MRPRTPIGFHGAIRTSRLSKGRYVAATRVRDLDGRLREVQATYRSRTGAETLLLERLKQRRGYGSGGVLSLVSPFTDLVDLWLNDLESRQIVEATKDNYRDDIRLRVRPWFEHYTLGEITTGRVEVFLKEERAVSYSRAKHSRTVLNQLFKFALRHDAIPRNPVEGTSPLARPKNTVQALTLDQVQAIRKAAAEWRTGAAVMGPKPDGQVRDACEVMLGTSVRPGEVLALRACDVFEGRRGMVVFVRGTVVYRRGKGTYRQEHPKTDASVRMLPVADFAARVIRRRLELIGPEDRECTIFHNRDGGPISLHNFRRTFRDFLKDAGLEDSGISPRWYRRTGATVIARGLGVDAAATHLGHTSSAVTEGHYIEPERVLDFGAANVLDIALRPVDPDGSLLARTVSDEEEDMLDQIDAAGLCEPTVDEPSRHSNDRGAA